jgi:hypothetical protein
MTTFDLTVRAVTRGGLLAAVLTLILVACGGASASPAPASPAAPPSDAPIDLPTGAPAALAFEDLASRLVELDGQTVTVTGYLLISDDQAHLCGVLLESYPPQCGAVTLRVLGEVPADVLDGLDTTTEPDIQQAWWGTVRITGVVAADGGDGTPTITIQTIESSEAL